MKKFLVALLAVNFLWNGQSYAAEKNLEELLDEQREIVKTLQSKKNDEQNKKLREHIDELEKQIEELKNKKTRLTKKFLN